MIRLAIAAGMTCCVVVLAAVTGCSGGEGGTAMAPIAASAAPEPGPGGGGGVTPAVAMFGAGCFWGVESTFQKVPGVLHTQVGYAGGKTERPTYEEVCDSETGHAEVVRVEYDPAKVSYGKLLEVFFENHDPTTLNRQGPDVGTQYRSVVFVHSPEQEKLARAEKQRRDASGEYVGPIVTDVQPAPPFWPAEAYHQQYFQKQGVDWVCHTGNGKKKKH